LREHDDYLFGPVVGRSRRVKVDEIENEFLRDGWLPDTVQDGAINSYVKSDTPKSNTTWIAEQVWRDFSNTSFLRRPKKCLTCSDLGVRRNQ
jgi:hypothetical protein